MLPGFAIKNNNKKRSGSEDVDLRSSSRFFTARFEYSAVNRCVFHHLSPRPSPLLHHYNTISTVDVLQAATQLEVVCLRFRVLHDVLLSIQLLLLLTSPRLLLCSCYTAVLVAPSQPDAYWWRRWCVRLPPRLGEWTSASRTFYTITAVLTVTRREVAINRSFVFIFL